MPAKKFCRMSLKAKPMATPPIPRVASASAGLKLGKTIVAAIKKPRITRPPCSKRPKTKPTLRVSRSRVCLRTNRLITFPAIQKITKTMMPMIRFGRIAIALATMSVILPVAVDSDTSSVISKLTPNLFSLSTTLRG